MLNLSDTFFHRVADPNEHYDLQVIEKKSPGVEVSSLLRFTDGFTNLIQSLSKKFEIIIYDSGSPQLLNQVLGHIDPEGTLISHCIYSSNCFPAELPEHPMSKDLRVLLNRKLSNIWYLSSTFDLPFDQLPNLVPVLPSRQLLSQEKSNHHWASLIQFLLTSEPLTSEDHFGLRELTSHGEAKDDLIRDFLSKRKFN